MFIVTFMGKFYNTIIYSLDTLTIDKVYDVFYFKEKVKHLVIGFEA